MCASPGHAQDHAAHRPPGPLHSTGVGKVLLADWTAEQVGLRVEDHGLERPTPHSVTSLEDLLSELAGVRSSGFAIDDEECEAGARCVAAPLRDFTEKVVASISVTGPATRMGHAKLGNAGSSWARLAQAVG